MLNRDTNGRLAGQNSSAKDAKKVRNLFQDFVERVSTGISVTDEEGRIIFWNPAMERTTGLAVDNALGRLIWEVHFNLLSLEMKNNEALDTLRGKFLSFLESGISDERDHKLELNYDHSGGTRLMAQGIIYAIPTIKGFCLFSILYADAVKFSPEEVLKTSEEKFRNVVEQAGDGIVVLDAQEAILEWNDGCEKISGIDRAHALGMHLTDLLPELFQGSEWALPHLSRPSTSKPSVIWAWSPGQACPVSLKESCTIAAAGENGFKQLLFPFALTVRSFSG